MKPARAILTAGLSLALALGPRAARASDPPRADRADLEPQAQTQSPPPETLERIRAAVTRPPAVKIENGQLRIYVEVIADWPTFAEATRGYDFINGPTGHGANPMSHQEFLDMVTPREMYSTAGIKPGEIVTMAAVNVIGQWALTKAFTKIASYRHEKQMREIQERIDQELAALRKNRDQPPR